MKVRITDPLLNHIRSSLGDFDEEWAKIGTAVKCHLRNGDRELTWCNLTVTQKGGTVEHPSMHRTIELWEAGE